VTELIFIDIETTGLDPELHQAWEIAWAGEYGDVLYSRLPHDLITADDKALEMNGYYDRGLFISPNEYNVDVRLRRVFAGNTLVAANPAFDTSFLRKRWGVAPWHYRLVDIESYAMPILDYDRPKGMATIYQDLVALGYNVKQPDHSAKGDVAALRDCYFALKSQQATLVKFYKTLQND
jgi:DNA polymerase III alpha subunit (gram-positive type)